MFLVFTMSVPLSVLLFPHSIPCANVGSPAGLAALAVGQKAGYAGRRPAMLVVGQLRCPYGQVHTCANITAVSHPLLDLFSFEHNFGKHRPILIIYSFIVADRN